METEEVSAGPSSGETMEGHCSLCPPAPATQVLPAGPAWERELTQELLGRPDSWVLHSSGTGLGRANPGAGWKL